MRSLLLLPVMAVLPLAACGDDGPRTSQSRDVPAFTKLANDSSVDVRVHVGAPQRLEVRAGENVIDDVRTDVRDGTLRLDFDHSGWGSSDVQVEVWTPALEAISSDGSGDIDAEGVQAPAFALDTDGSGDVRVSGTTRTLRLTVDGSGNAKLAGLTAAQADVRAGGSGDTDVRADDRLTIEADGSGDVRYHGEPQLTQRHDGSGNVERAS